MKHPPILRLLTTLLLALTATAASAYDFKVDGIYYNKNSDGTSVSVTYENNLSAYSGSVTIPSQVTYSGKTYHVTSIGNYAFNNCYGLTSVTIPNSVTSIGSSAFSYCKGLTSVTIPNSVTSIGEEAFRECYSLTSVTIPNSVTSIESRTFAYCSGLTSVTIPNSVTTIRGTAFGWCSGLKTVIIGNGAKEVGSSYYGAFVGCNNLIKSAYPQRITNPFESGFAIAYPNDASLKDDGTIRNDDNTALYYVPCDITEFTIDENIKSISANAFDGCTLSKLILNAENCNDLDYNWHSNLSLSAIGIGPKVKRIPGFFFYEFSLKYVLIPNTVTEIGKYAFLECSRLNSVTIGNSVTEIGEGAFSNSGLILVTFPSSVTSIGNSVFLGCTGLTEVTMPNSITSIGYKAFSGCSSLKTVTFGNSVTSIGDYAFEDCDGLTSMIIPNSVTEIGEYAFSYCDGLTAMTIPNNIESIGAHAFTGCSNLKSVTFNATNCKKVGAYWLNDRNGTSFTIGNDVQSLPDSFCKNLSFLTSISIPKSVTTIGAEAFSGCSNLQSVVFNASNCEQVADSWLYPYVTSFEFGNTVKSIPNGLCKGLILLSSVSIPNSVSSVGTEAFSGCKNLVSISIPNSVTRIGRNAFEGTTYYSNFSDGPVYCGRNLYQYKGTAPYGTELTIKDGIVSISEYAFSELYGLKSITIPDDVIVLGNNAFDSCYDLTSVIIGNGVEEVSKDCFFFCMMLQDLTIGSNVKRIRSSAFANCLALSTIRSNAITPPSMLNDNSENFEDAFASVDKGNARLFVPDGAVSAYQSARGWKDFVNISPLGNEDVSIDGGVEVSVDGGVLHCGGVDTEVYTLSGVPVYSGCGDVELAAGAYIVVAQGRATKVVVK